MQHIVVLSGAGISAESGLKTFRDMGGLWENYDVKEVASPEGWAKNPALVLRFYNERRQQLATVSPNAAHLALVELEKKYKVTIVTQNVDNLHERAGSSHILHLHGELTKVRSVKKPNKSFSFEGDIQLGDVAEDGGQLRPHIVWFGEEVPLIGEAAAIMQTADIVIVVGTSLVVYPAAGLLEYAPYHAHLYIVDPDSPRAIATASKTYIAQKATEGIPALVAQLLAASDS